jgi:hypothetical protein
MNAQLIKDLLQKNILNVTFTKVDGTERVMNCTLRSDIVTPYEKKTDRVKAANSDIVTVWDIDKEAWRSFNYDSVKDFAVQQNEVKV